MVSDETPLGPVTDYKVNWGREFRYDGARARYLVRELDPAAVASGNFTTVLSEVWAGGMSHACVAMYDKRLTLSSPTTPTT